MKLKAIVATTLLVALTGCEAGELTKARAKYQCKDLGGVYKIFHSAGIQVICKDGSEMKLTKEPLPEGWRVGDTK